MRVSVCVLGGSSISQKQAVFLLLLHSALPATGDPKCIGNRAGVQLSFNGSGGLFDIC